MKTVINSKGAEVEVLRGDVSAFRKLQNERFPAGDGSHRNGRYHQAKRGYGDYTYSQDRDMFNIDMADWISQGRPQ